MQNLLASHGKTVAASDTKLGKVAVKDLQKFLKPFKNVKVATEGSKLKLTLGKSYAMLMPIWMAKDLPVEQKRVVQCLQKYGRASLAHIQTHCKLAKNEAKQQVDKMVKAKIVEILPSKLYHLA